jgi:hypothetical protein
MDSTLHTFRLRTAMRRLFVTQIEPKYLLKAVLKDIVGRRVTFAELTRRTAPAA